MWLLTRRLNWNGDERPALANLREVAATPTIGLWGAGAPYEIKDELRARGYRWMPMDRERIPRSWWIDIHPELVNDELTGLAGLHQVHGHVLDPGQIPLREISARERDRAGPLDTR